MGIDWGSVADWISGIGSLSAVLAALVIARQESKRAARAEAILRQQDLERRAATHSHIAHITSRLIELTQQIQNEIEAPEDIYSLWSGELGLVKERAERIKAFPGLDLASFIYIDRVLTLFASPIITGLEPHEVIGQMPKIALRLIRFKEWYENGEF